MNQHKVRGVYYEYFDPLSFLTKINSKVTLETLKDLHLERADTRINDILKASAVEDIKAIHRGELVSDDVEEYIKWKNNLTEEDLK